MALIDTDKRTLRSRLGDLTIEIVAIVLSVLLALAVNDWREWRKRQSTVGSLLETLRSEVLENEKEVGRALAYHQALVQELHQGGRRLVSINLQDYPLDTKNANRMKQPLRARLIAMGFPIPSSFELIQMTDSEIYFELRGSEGLIRIEGDSLNLYVEGGIQLRSANIRNLSWETAQAMQVLVHMDYQLVALWSEIHNLQEFHHTTVSRILDKLYGGSGTILPVLEDLVYIESQLLQKYEAIQSLIEGGMN